MEGENAESCASTGLAGPKFQWRRNCLKDWGYFWKVEILSATENHELESVVGIVLYSSIFYSKLCWPVFVLIILPFTEFFNQDPM